MTDTQNNRDALPRHGALNLLDGLLKNASIPTAAKARLRTIRLHLEALIDREQNPAAAQEAVALIENARAATDFSTNHATAKPDIGNTEKEHILGLCRVITGLVAHIEADPVAAAPADEFKGVAERAVLAFARVAQELGVDPAGGADAALAAIAKLRTPAAPGIDLEPFREPVNYWHNQCSATHGIESVVRIRSESKRLLALIDQADASPKGGSGAEPMFYIQDTRSFVGNCPVWWGPNGNGYVTRLDEAGRFTEQEAIAQNRTRDTDVPWPCAEIDKLARITVDAQHMRPRSERLAELQATSAEVKP